MSNELDSYGITLDIAGPGQHVPAVERMIQSVKKRVRCYENSVPHVMTRLLLIMFVLFCFRRVNMQPSITATDQISSLEQFSVRKLDANFTSVLVLRTTFTSVSFLVSVFLCLYSPSGQCCVIQGS